MEENKFITLLSRHWSKFLLGILALATLAIWSERLLNTGKSQNKHDFIIINQIFERFNRGEALSTESIESAENILTRHPELHPKYDSMLALSFLSQSQIDKGAPYAQSIFERCNSELPPLHKQYALATFLISQENYSEAFDASLDLENKLQGQKNYQILEAMNTLRLVFLAVRMGDASQKNSFWKKLEQHPAYSCVESVFHEGKISLADYINKIAF